MVHRSNLRQDLVLNKHPATHTYPTSEACNPSGIGRRGGSLSAGEFISGVSYLGSPQTVPVVRCGRIVSNSTWTMEVVEIRPLVLFENDPHQCKQCDRSYKYKDSLARHIKQAHSDIVFSCNVCEKTYKSDNALRRHSKTHQENAQIQCKECDQRFVEKYRLLWHMAFDHRGELMRCARCYRGFRTMWGYKRHMREAHVTKERNVKTVGNKDTSRTTGQLQ